MELDGLRAWIGVVERKLTMRTRVFLVLVAIAAGGAGAAIYVALDTQDNAVSKGELRAVWGELTEGAGGDTSQLEAEIAQLKSELEALKGGGAGGQGTGGGGGAQAPNAPEGLFGAPK